MTPEIEKLIERLQDAAHYLKSYIYTIGDGSFNDKLRSDIFQATSVLGAQQGRVDAEKRELIGWLSGDIPELHRVEVGRLAESLDRFNAKLAQASEQNAAAVPDKPVETDRAPNVPAPAAAPTARNP